MAQETAGTIGIPVLKNEVLPYLTDYAKRQERAQLYKQKAEQRAAELAAKKAGEMDKYVAPALATAEGGYWNPWINKQMKVEAEAAKEKIKAARTPAEGGAAAEEFNRKYKAYNYSGDQETQRQRENIKSLRDTGYNVDENALAQYYGEQAETNPNFSGTNHIVNFKEWVKARPEKYINPAVVGTNLLKQYEPVSVGIKTKEGKDESFTYNPLFEPERVKDPLTGANIFRAQKPNLIKFEEALKGNENLREAAEAYIQPIANRVKAANPGMSSTEAYTLGLEEFLNKSLPQGRAKETYDYSEFKPRTGDGSKPPMDYKYKMGETEASVPTYSPDGKIKKAQNFKIGQSSDYGIPLGTTNHQAGLIGIPLTELDDNEVTKIIKYNDDGSVTINRSITYDNPIRRTVYRAKGDIQFFDKAGKPTYRVKKRGIIGNIEAGVILAGPNKNLVGKETGYEITARTKNPFSSNMPDIEKEIRIWVSDADAGSIKGNIKKMQKKAPVEGMEEIDKLIY